MYIMGRELSTPSSFGPPMSPDDTFSLPYSACQCLLLPLCFQSLPTIKFSNHFVLKTIRIARGVWGLRLLLTSLLRYFITSRSLLSPLECAVPRFRLLSPLECAVPKTPRRNPFRMRSSKKRWGGGCQPGKRLPPQHDGKSRLGERLGAMMESAMCLAHHHSRPGVGLC